MTVHCSAWTTDCGRGGRIISRRLKGTTRARGLMAIDYTVVDQPAECDSVDRAGGLDDLWEAGLAPDPPGAARLPHV